MTSASSLTSVTSLTTTSDAWPTKRPWALALARRYVRHTLARRFENVTVIGLDAVRAAAAAGPLLFVPNHVSYWDAFVVVAVDEALGTDGRCVMDEDNLARLSFFRALGAVPISLRDPRRAISQLAAVARFLSGPQRAAWLFPQGKLVPSWRRPLGFQSGFVRVARDSGALLVPVSVLVRFGKAPEPTLAVKLHAPRAADTDKRACVDAVSACVAGGLDDLDADLDAALDDNVAAVPSVRSSVPLVRGTAARGPGLGARVLARLTGGTR